MLTVTCRKTYITCSKHILFGGFKCVEEKASCFSQEAGDQMESLPLEGRDSKGMR